MVQILNERQIGQKIRRLAIQIAEQNWQEAEIVLAGINAAGRHLAEVLRQELADYVPEMPVRLVHLKIHAADPLSAPVESDGSPDCFDDKPVIIVDDVANTGRTLFHAFQPLLAAKPKKVQIAVLIDRKHKTYPVHVDYVGMSLATTLHEHIEVLLPDSGERAVYLT